MIESKSAARTEKLNWGSGEEQSSSGGEELNTPRSCCRVCLGWGGTEAGGGGKKFKMRNREGQQRELTRRLRDGKIDGV